MENGRFAATQKLGIPTRLQKRIEDLEFASSIMHNSETEVSAG